MEQNAYLLERADQGNGCDSQVFLRHAPRLGAGRNQTHGQMRRVKEKGYKRKEPKENYKKKAACASLSA